MEEIYTAKVYEDDTWYHFHASYRKSAIDSNVEAKALKEFCVIPRNKLSKTLELMKPMTEALENGR